MNSPQQQENDVTPPPQPSENLQKDSIEKNGGQDSLKENLGEIESKSLQPSPKKPLEDEPKMMEIEEKKQEIVEKIEKVEPLSEETKEKAPPVSQITPSTSIATTITTNVVNTNVNTSIDNNINCPNNNNTNNNSNDKKEITMEIEDETSKEEIIISESKNEEPTTGKKSEQKSEHSLEIIETKEEKLERSPDDKKHESSSQDPLNESSNAFSLNQATENSKEPTVDYFKILWVFKCFFVFQGVGRKR